MPLTKNSEHLAEITGYTGDGAGVARIDGQVVFIPGTITGELCRVKILKVNRTVAYGRLLSVERASEHRIAPDCPAYPKCGGCAYRHMDYEAELAAKQAHVCSVLARIGGVTVAVDPIVAAPDTARYRNKAQFPVGMQNGQPVAGFYRAHSHDIVPCEDCLIQSEFANAARRVVLAWMRDCAVPAYDEATGRGVVRHIYVRNTMLCLVVARTCPQTDALVDRVRRALPDVSGVLLNYQPEKTNVILGARTELLFGAEYVADTLCGNAFQIAPHAFYQVNHAQTERLYAHAIQLAGLSGRETVLDLYCGAGTITLALAAHAGRAIGAEIVPQAVENARIAAQRGGYENVEFFCADAAKAANALEKRGVSVDVVVVDPPRKGLDPALIETIAQLAPARVVYVSCDPATLARDVARFAPKGYAAQRITPFDLFPRTRHVETVCLLSKTL